MTDEGNDTYRATIHFSNYDSGDMVRWYVVASTASGETTREPPFADPTESAEYFGTVITESAGPIRCTGAELVRAKHRRRRHARRHARLALLSTGEFYDNIFCRIRGQSTANWPKHKYKFDFYRGGHFHWKSGAPEVEEFNVNSHYRDAYVRENTIFAFLNEAGSLAPETMYLWIRRNGSDMGLFTFVEQVDEEFLTRRGFDATGSMYKAINVPATLSPTVNTSLYRKVLRKNEPYTDLQALATNINIANPDRFDYVADEVNLPNYINVMAAMAVPFNHDQLTKNYYLYRDPNRDEWFRIAWDGDQGLPTGQKINATTTGRARSTATRCTRRSCATTATPTRQWQNHLHAAILDNPVTRQMYMRRRAHADGRLPGDHPEAGPSTTILAEGAASALPRAAGRLAREHLVRQRSRRRRVGRAAAAGFGYENSAPATTST